MGVFNEYSLPLKFAATFSPLGSCVWLPSGCIASLASFLGVFLHGRVTVRDNGM